MAYKAQKAKRRVERLEKEAHPSRHIWLPSGRSSTAQVQSNDSDSEDTTPSRKRIVGKGYKSWITNEGIYRNTNSHDAVAKDLRRVKEHNSSLSPHSCQYCCDLEIDLRHIGADYRYKPAEQGGWLLFKKWDRIPMRYAQEKADQGCLFLQRLLGVRMPQNSPSIGELDMSLYVSLRQNPVAHFSSTTGREGASYEIYTPLDVAPSLSCNVGLVPPNLAPNSDLSFMRAKEWIRACSTSHTKCGPLPGNFMPKRVLEVFGSDEKPSIKLSTDHPPTSYVALSYCWGADQPAKTMTANFHDYLSEIPFDTLPLTIQHAAAVTRGIGMRYLWVDAMCIIQDDDDDKLDQISQMHAIYRNSWVTIAAAEAKTCNDGFLQPRSEWQPVKVKARFDDNVFSEVIMVPEGQSCRPEAPLFQRGWTMQETLLSTRLLLYGAKELTFLCMEDQQSEGGVPPSVRQYQMLFDPGSNAYVEMDHPGSWSYLVSAYSQRRLSLEEDKLLGIGALAESYGRTKNTKEYFAGMWKEEFLQQCLWTTETYTSEDKAPRRPAKYRAPSWSWASTEGQISGFGASANMPAMMMPETMPPITTCEIVEVEVKTVLAGNPFGMVTGGHLKIRGKLRQIIWYDDGASWNTGRLVRDTEEPRVERSDRRVDMDRRMNVQIDHPKDWPQGEEILLWSLEICKTSEGRGYALLLNEAGGHNDTFQRVGRLKVIEGTNNWFDAEHELREIKIV